MRVAFAVLVTFLTLAGCVAPGADVDPNDADLGAAGATLADAQALVHSVGDNLSGRLADEVAAVSYFIGHDAAEPTIAIAEDGTMFYAAITFDNDLPTCTLPDPATQCLPRTDILRSTDGGRTWEDVTPYFPGGVVRMHPETGDPMVYIDPVTQRVFDIDQRGAVSCYTVSFSDDLGESWLGAFPACDAPPADHQTILAVKPRVLPASPVYPNFVYVCWNQIYATACTRSTDGGMTFQRVAPPYSGFAPGEECIVGPLASALVGHLKASPDGVIYLPKDHCGMPQVAVTADDGLTWNVVIVSDRVSAGNDPVVAVDADGTAYYAFQEAGTGHLFLAVSTDDGASWSEAVDITPPGITATHLPAMVAGDAGRLAIAWLGTDDPEGYEQELAADEANGWWHGYLSVLTEANTPTPKMTTVRVNPLDDPLSIGHCGPGRCPGNYDFIDIQVDAAGRPWGAFVDACPAECVASEEPDNPNRDGFVATLVTGPGLFAATPELPPLAPKEA